MKPFPARSLASVAFAAAALCGSLEAAEPVVGAHHPRRPRVMWLNHFSLLPGDPSVVSTSSNSTSSGVGGGLTALVIESSTTGEVDSLGGNKVVHMALDLPWFTVVHGVRVCYQLTRPTSFISQVRLAQVQDPPATAVVRLDDGTDLTATGPVCVNTESLHPGIRARDGSLLLSLRVNYGDTADKIAVRAVGLLVN